MCLKPGLVLLNSKRASKDNLPEIFNKWDKIWFDDVAPTSEKELIFQKDIRDPIAKELTNMRFSSNLGSMSSPWVGMNILSLDTETVLVDERQTNLINKLKEYKFKTIPVKLRHMYTQGGGIHCATLDTVRESKLESYFD
jgi:glycine amidinotransferase/scyllo-inosamine-4-phosphate amidinotransferase 1